jgi:acyl-CoA synthetase (AMP-forming)/AMP-acid ligase II
MSSTIGLTEAEPLELRQRATSRSGRADDGGRARLILLLEAGHSWAQIRDRLGCNDALSGIPAEDWIAHHARFAPNSEAAHDLGSGRRFTYAQFDKRIMRAALWLARAFGVKRGDRVAMLSMNDTDVFELQFGCRRLGAIFLPLNWRLAVPELEVICKDGTPVVLIHGAEFADAALQVAKLAGVPRTADMANGKPSAYKQGGRPDLRSRRMSPSREGLYHAA